MAGMLDLHRRNQLPERERAVCMQLLLQITIKDNLFDDGERSQAGVLECSFCSCDIVLCCKGFVLCCAVLCCVVAANYKVFDDVNDCSNALSQHDIHHYSHPTLSPSHCRRVAIIHGGHQGSQGEIGRVSACGGALRDY
jgi:hypothetical protein